MSQGNIKCPIHGEHGNSAGGKCWYCVQSGISPAVKPNSAIPSKPGIKRKIA